MNVKYSQPNSTSGYNSKITTIKVTDQSLHCDHCNMSGHTSGKFFVLHGYPEWHRLHDHPKPKPRNANHKKSNGASSSTIIAHMTTREKSTVGDTLIESSPGLSQNQCQQLINMLQATSIFLFFKLLPTRPCFEKGERDC